MRVLEVINSLRKVGGSETFSIHLSKYLKKTDDVYVCVLYNQNNDFLMSSLESSVSPNHLFVLHKGGSFDTSVAKAISKIIQDNRIEIIHTENDALISSYLAIRRLKNKPHIIHTLHNPPKEECRGHIKRAIYKYIFRKKIATPVAISDEMASEARKVYGLEKIPVIQNGVDTDQFNKITPFSKRSVDCTIIARLEDQKNYPFVLKVFNKAHVINNSLKFAIYGTGSKKDWLLSSIKGFDYISYRGITKSPQIAMNDTKIFILGSKFEGNPMTLWEAMACGCICVVPNINGLDKIVKNNTGFVLDPENSDLFAQTICKIVANYKMSESLSSAAVEWAKANSFNVVSAKYHSLFQKYAN